MIYAVVKRYETETENFWDWTYNPHSHNGFDAIYSRIMQITGNNHEVSNDAASWCELATVGEIYEFDGGEIEMTDIE